MYNGHMDKAKGGRFDGGNLETNENKYTTSKSMGHNKSSPEREIHNIIDQLQEARKISNKQSNCTP